MVMSHYVFFFSFHDNFSYAASLCQSASAHIKKKKKRHKTLSPSVQFKGDHVLGEKEIPQDKGRLLVMTIKLTTNNLWEHSYTPLHFFLKYQGTLRLRLPELCIIFFFYEPHRSQLYVHKCLF